MEHAHAPDASKYFIPHGSPWPIVGSVALFTLMGGAVAQAGAAFKRQRGIGAPGFKGPVAGSQVRPNEQRRPG